MKKKMIILISLFLLISSITLVSATDTTVSDQNNQTIQSDTTSSTLDIDTVDKEINIKESTTTVNSYTELYDKIEEIKGLTSSDEQVINLEAGDYNITNTINWGNTTHTTSKLTINGNNITLDGQKTLQFITVSPGYTLELKNITVQNCYNTQGSVIYNQGEVAIEDSTFTNNSATQGGVTYTTNTGISTITGSTFTQNNAPNGGVNDNRGILTITSSNFTNNSAYNGGVNFNNNILTITGSTFTQNNAISGGVNRNEGNLTIIDSIFTQNVASGYGGVNDIYSSSSNLSITGSIFTENNAYSGGVNSNYGTLLINNSTFTKNNATTGGVNFNRYNIIINNSTFTQNNATNGSVNYNYYYNLTIANSNFTKNTAVSWGGVNYNDGNLNITDSNFSENSGVNGGVNDNRGILTITNSNFTKNSAYSGGVNFNNKILTITSSTFTQNNATSGGVNRNEGNLTITNSIFTENIANVYGGVNDNYGNSSNLNINNSTFTKNTAYSGGVNDVHGNMTINDSIFTQNSATNGGVNFIYNKNLIIANSTFTQNNATMGGVNSDMNNGNITIIDSKFTQNSAKEGIIVYSTNGTYNLTNNFINNTNTLDIPIISTKNSNLILTNTIILVYTDEEYTNPVNITSPIKQTKDETTTFIIEKTNYTTTSNATPSVEYNFTTNKLQIIPVTLESQDNNNIIKLYIGEIRNATVQLSLSQTSVKYNDEIKITANINDEETSTPIDDGSVIFKINGKTLKDNDGNPVKVALVDGQAILNYTIPKERGSKNYTVTAVYQDIGYNRVESTTNLDVIKTNTTFTINPITINKGENTTISTTILDENGNTINNELKVVIKVNGKTITTTTIKQTLNITIPTEKLREGEYNLTIIVGENSNYNTQVNSTTITINKKDVNITVTTDLETTVGSSIQIKANITNNNVAVTEGIVIFKINGKTLTDKDNNQIEVVIGEDGIATLNYTLPNTIGEGTYNITAVYTHKNYNRNENTTKITIKQIEPTIIIEELKLTENSIQLGIILTDDDLNVISHDIKTAIKIDEKTVEYTTITNGVLNTTINLEKQLKEGNHIITIITTPTSQYAKTTTTEVVLYTTDV